VASGGEGPGEVTVRLATDVAPAMRTLDQIDRTATRFAIVARLDALERRLADRDRADDALADAVRPFRESRTSATHHIVALREAFGAWLDARDAPGPDTPTTPGGDTHGG
jgi:hypothetical protein